MTLRRILPCTLAFTLASATAQNPVPAAPHQVFGYADFAQQAKWDAAFLQVPDAALAGQHLKILTAEPHWASSPEDYKTALYVADQFKAAGLKTEIVPYKVLMNRPVKILIEAFNEKGKKLMSGPTPEHVDSKDGGDPYQDNSKVLPPFNGGSASGDVTAPVVYANYGTLQDFKQLAKLGISVKNKIVLVRYGQNYRGVKAYIAQQYGAKGVLIYSDPADTGYFRGEMYPKGPWGPSTAVQRGSVQFLAVYSGDPQTPGIASTPDLPDAQRIAADKVQANLPSIPVNPLSYHDAAPILQALGGQVCPHEWQGALPFTYHLGSDSPAGTVTAHMQLQQDYALRTIWDVTGTIPGSEYSNELVVAGNHRDAWVYGAVDPNSGTAAMLESVHGLGALLKQGWKPRRTIVVASWDAEEEGLIGSTEWVEQHASQLRHAVAYLNTDVAVSGPDFEAAAVPSLQQFVREVTQQVPSPKGGTVYDQWKKQQNEHPEPNPRPAVPSPDGEVQVGSLGSGSDFTPFFQHIGVPSTDIGSGGPYGVYHSVFDNYAWFTKNADPTFVYEQQQARVFGLEILHMADADVLPYDYAVYARAIESYIAASKRSAAKAGLTLDFTAAEAAAKRFEAAGTAARLIELAPPQQTEKINATLRQTEAALLNPAGLPKRPWYKHVIYDPGEYTGYAAVVIPGVTEAVESANAIQAQEQLSVLTTALDNASSLLSSVSR